MTQQQQAPQQPQTALAVESPFETSTASSVCT